MYEKREPVSEKAYKLVALQENISNREAKDLIDRGLVSVGDKKVKIARDEYPVQSTFKVQALPKPKTLFEDEKIIAVEKPAFLISEEVARMYKGATLLHRLDKETSGVMLLTKDEEFRLEAVEEFKQEKVYKEYIAWVNGIVSESVVIDKPILTVKGKTAHSKIAQNGKRALTEVEPLEISGKRTKVKVLIHTGRTHQIRVHLSSIGHAVLGDKQYGGKEYSRIMLHAHKIGLMGREFVSAEPKEFGRV